MTYIPSPAYTNHTQADGYYDTYICPSVYDRDGSLLDIKERDKRLLGWLREAIEEGSSFLKACKSYEDIDKAIDLISDKVQDNLSQSGAPNTLSVIFVNSIKRDVKEMAAILSNIRPSWIYEANSSKDEQWLHQARIQNGLARDSYDRSFFDRKLKKLLQWAITEGTGYISPVWNPHLYGFRQGGIEYKLHRYNEVFPIQIGNDFDLQRAYAVIIKEEIPINRLRRMFPHKAHLFVADRGMPATSRGLIHTAVYTAMEAIGMADSNRQRTSPSPVVDVYYAYIDDLEINRTDHEIPMGEASWSYKVPYVGQQMMKGYNGDSSIRTQRASYEDCYLYPNRRLIIATSREILYQGPSFWWHGKVPLVKYAPDEWVWSYLGYSMATEVASMQRSAISMRRAVEDALNLKLDPPVAVDDKILSKNQAESKSLRVPGRRIRGPLAMGDFIKPIANPNTYNVGAEHFGYIKEVEEKIKEILGLPDLKNLQKAKQVPSSDSIEKFFAEAGAIVTDMSRSMDQPIYEIADMDRYYFFQFDNIERRIKLLGTDGLTEEDFDYEPGTLIPASLPNEPKNDLGIYESSRIERAKRHINNFCTRIVPTSLHQITHMQRRLLYMQATKLNPFLVDPETLSKQLDIPNWGHLDGDTILEKVKSFMEIQKNLGLKQQFDQAMLQALIQQIMQSQSPEAQASDAMQGVADALKSAMGNGQVGRPPEFKEAPKLEQRGDRTLISTSGQGAS